MSVAVTGTLTPNARRHASFCAFILISSLAFLRTLSALVQYSLHDDSSAHIVLIPLVALFLLHSERKTIFSTTRTSMSSGVGLVLGGLIFLCGTCVMSAVWLVPDDVMLDAVRQQGTTLPAIQNMTPLSPIWQACRTVLKPGGKLIVVMMHPCFRVPKQSDWIWEDRGSGGVGEQGRVIKQYLTSSKVEIQTHPGLAAHGKDASATSHFHRPLQAYVNTMGNAGLLIDHVEEWISHKTSQAGPKKAALDRARKEIPMFLALRAKKQS